METRELVLPSLGCTTSEQKVKSESSTAMRERLPSLPAWWRRHVRRRRELFFLASSILNHKILKTNLAFRIQNFPDVECGTPNPPPKKTLVVYWVAGLDRIRMSHGEPRNGQNEQHWPVRPILPIFLSPVRHPVSSSSTECGPPRSHSRSFTSLFGNIAAHFSKNYTCSHGRLRLICAT